MKTFLYTGKCVATFGETVVGFGDKVELDPKLPEVETLVQQGVLVLTNKDKKPQ